MSGLIPVGTSKALKARKLSYDTASLYGYTVSEHNDETVHVANYKDNNGNIIAQHIRTQDKQFSWKGKAKEVTLYGQWLFSGKGKMVVICEGEIDCLTVSQMQGNKYPVVSVPNGAGGAKQNIKKAFEWLNGYDNIIFMFDMDDVGQQAAKECAALFHNGKAKIAHLSMKDPNELLVAGKGQEIVSAIWNANPYKPDGIISLRDAVTEITKPVVKGIPWFLESMTQWTHGRRNGDLYFFGAGTGVGKTDFFTQSIAYDLKVLNQKVATFYLEQDYRETGKRIAGKIAGKHFHLPDASWTQEELDVVLNDESIIDNLYLYDSFGSTEWESIKEKIIYLANDGVSLFYIDHLTALATGKDKGERELLEEITQDMASVAKKYNIILHVISHLATPDGKSHEEGGRVLPKHFKGSRAIQFWAYFLFALERNTLAKNVNDRHKTKLVCLKDRFTGRSTGEYQMLGYENVTGKLFETDEDVDEVEEEFF